ncbi:ABC transporter substrate-binding protein [Paenibacillus filicis]|uniref:ABC transporter substrate-binding protein n=1 Tax=Paenibacillus filicis TaxID=669464 RepID=A0ABU9DUG4_9BACL
MSRFTYVCKPGLLIVIFTLLLAACSSAPAEPAGKEAANPKPAEQTAQQPTTKKFKGENGEIEVPAQPKRIVAITFLGDLLALGVKPVGAGSLALENSVLLEKELQGVVNVGDVSMEKVLELTPDLIIVPSYLPAENIENLSKIAPTVSIVSSGFSGGDPLEELKKIGSLIGKEAEADAFIARYKQKAAEAKEKIAKVIGPQETVGSYSIWAKNIWVWPTGRDANYNLLQMFGLKPQDKIKADIVDTGQAKDISLEVLPQYAADHMFITVYEPAGGKERAKELMEGPVWKNIPAVGKKHVYLLNYKEFWMTDGLNLEKQLDILVKTVGAGN